MVNASNVSKTINQRSGQKAVLFLELFLNRGGGGGWESQPGIPKLPKICVFGDKNDLFNEK